MSLFTTLQIAKGTLFANQVGLQVTGNNIANANTPGYVRQEAVFVAAPTQKIGNLVLGLGVKVDSIVQAGDEFLNERLRNATSDVQFGQAQEQAYAQLESILAELGDADISTALTDFFNGFSEVLNQPESVAARSFTTLQAESLAFRIRHVNTRVRRLRDNLNQAINYQGETVNQLIDEVARLNVAIIEAEGGSSDSAAVSLRDSRNEALNQLAAVIDIKVVQQPDGAVNVFSGGEFLVFGGEPRRVVSTLTNDRGQSVNELRLEDTDFSLPSSSGALGGMISARDDVLGGFLDQLDGLAQSLITSVNRTHSGGQGLVGFDRLTSEFGVTDEELSLDQAALEFPVESGRFDVQVFNRQTGLTTTTPITIQLDGLHDDTTLADLAEDLDAIEGLRAVVSPDRKLRIDSESSELEFGFHDDTSGVLASLGVNSLFTGTSSATINVNQQLLDRPALLAASDGGIGANSRNAERLALLIDTPIAAQDGKSIADTYETMVADVTENAAITKAVADGFRTFQGSLQSDQLGLSGVSLDEEAINMITYQRAYQAAAKLVSTVDEMLQVLMTL